jgi:hypothetical protein
MTVSETTPSSSRHRTSASVVISFLVAVTVLAASALPSVGAISAGSTTIGSGKVGATSDNANDSGNSKACGKQRGKVLGECFDEHDLLRAYEEIKLDYHEKAFAEADTNDQQSSSSSSWKLLTTMNPNKKKRFGAKRRNSDKNNGNDDDDDEIIKVSMLEHPSDPLCPYVKMETVIPKSVEKCWNFLSLDRWDESMAKMDPFYEGLDIYGEYSVSGGKSHPTENVDDEAGTKTATKTATAAEPSNADHTIRMILARKRTKRILAFGKREFVFVSVEDIPLADGTWVSGTVSVEVDESKDDDGTGNGNSNGATKSQSTATTNALHLLRRNKSYTRAFQDSIAFYKPLPAADDDDEKSPRTKLTIICRIDLNDSSGEHGSNSNSNNGGNAGGGCIPMWLYVKTVGITGARSVLTMRNCLLEGA